MRSKKRPDLGDVHARFEAWRARSPRKPIPDELWVEAAALLDRYTAQAVCQKLRLNQARFKQMREALAAAKPPSPQSHTHASSRSMPSRSRVGRRVRDSGRGGNGGRAPGSADRRRAAASPGFVHLGALEFDPLAHLRTAADEKASGCSLLIEKPDGSRLRLELPVLDATALQTLCASFLEHRDIARRRRRR